MTASTKSPPPAAATDDRPAASTNSGEAERARLQASARRPVEHDILLSALPHPIIVLGEDNRVVYANAAAEVFLSISLAFLKRQTLDEVVAFGCPLLALVDQVRRTGASVNEYGVEMMTPKFSTPKLIDVYGEPYPDQPGLVLLMLQQRTMAQMIERQLTHRAAARSVSGMAAVLAHEIKNPLSGIRGAAQLLEHELSDEDRTLTQLICSETDRIRDLVDRMEVFGDERPLAREAVNIHDVLDHVRRLAETGFGGGIRWIAGLRSLAAARARQPRQAGPGLPQSRQERRRGDRGNATSPAASSCRPRSGRACACPSAAAARASACR